MDLIDAFPAGQAMLRQDVEQVDPNTPYPFQLLHVFGTKLSNLANSCPSLGAQPRHPATGIRVFRGHSGGRGLDGSGKNCMGLCGREGPFP